MSSRQHNHYVYIGENEQSTANEASNINQTNSQAHSSTATASDQTPTQHSPLQNGGQTPDQGSPNGQTSSQNGATSS